MFNFYITYGSKYTKVLPPVLYSSAFASPTFWILFSLVIIFISRQSEILMFDFMEIFFILKVEDGIECCCVCFSRKGSRFYSFKCMYVYIGHMAAHVKKNMEEAFGRQDASFRVCLMICVRFIYV